MIRAERRRGPPQTQRTPDRVATAHRRRRRAVGVCALLLMTLSGALGWPASASATPQYAGQTGRLCGFCHETPGGRLTPAGEAFRANGYRLAPAQTPLAPGSTPGASGPGSPGPQPASRGGGPGGMGGPLIDLAPWLRTLLLAAHILAAMTWVGGIVVVFFVQTPQVAAAGIPRGYLRIGWLAIGTVGVTGILLVADTVDGLSQIWAGHWGHILTAKIVVYLLLVASAATATFLLSPRLRRAAEGPRRGASLEQLRAQGRVAVRYQGRVYDFTGSRLWPEGRHVKRHDAWQDLTSAMAGAPHGAEVLERFTLVADSGDGPPRSMRVFVGLTYANLALVVTEVILLARW